jgi:hypothetical protein
MTDDSAAGASLLSETNKGDSMKHVPTALFLAATMFSLTSSLIAQQPLKANVPFDFSVAGSVLPAGEYRIDHQGAFLRIEKRDDHRTMTLLAVPGEPSANGSSFLSFDHLNGNFILRRVVTPYAVNSLDLQLKNSDSTRETRTIGLASVSRGR